MANEKRLINANALKEALEFADADVCESDEFGAMWGFSKHGIVELINKLPTVDAVEVVRCDKCVFWQDGYLGYCYKLHVAMEYDDYCSCGERKDNENIS